MTPKGDMTMKRSLRIILLTLVIATLLSVLCGCSDLDEMRATQAFLTDKDNEILYNGETYILLEDAPKDCYRINGDKRIYVTEADVPVLLCHDYCELRGYVGKKNYILCLAEDSSPFNITLYYCREDKYDDAAEYIKNLY